MLFESAVFGYFEILKKKIFLGISIENLLFLDSKKVLETLCFQHFFVPYYIIPNNNWELQREV